ncbi:MAG: helix-turn-helix transcriptional regulator [Anaerolineae bacterium]|nr:helix-turn-helix transcriptional regulator [Anaerolineae bacterium]
MITTKGNLTVLLGKRQMMTGERWTLRHLAREAEVTKELVYRLDAGTARYVDIDALARLCKILGCDVEDILTQDGHNGSTPES